MADNPERDSAVEIALIRADLEAMQEDLKAVRKELTGRSVRVSLPGGDLLIEWRESDGHVLMTGPVELEHEGVLAPSVFAGAA